MHCVFRVSDAFTSQMKFDLSRDPQQLSPGGRALLQMASGSDAGDNGGTVADDAGNGKVPLFEAEMRILEQLQDDPSQFGILELRGEASKIQVGVQQETHAHGRLGASTDACGQGQRIGRDVSLDLPLRSMYRL